MTRTGVTVWAFLALVPALGAALLAPGLAESVMQSGAGAAIPPPPPAPVLMLAAGAQSFVLFGLAAAAGLWLASRIGKRPDLLFSLTRGAAAPADTARSLATAAGIGVLTGLVLLTLDAVVFGTELSTLSGSVAVRLAGAMLYGGVGEEVLCRLLIVSAVVWLASKVAGRPAGPVVWTVAILIAALLFGLGHIPAADALGLLEDKVDVARILVVNGVGGMVFGLLFWRNGLEWAVIAHAAAHLPLQLLPGLL